MSAPRCGQHGRILFTELDAYDTLQQVLMPDELWHFVDSTKMLNLSTVPYSGEGADFKLEEVND